MTTDQKRKRENNREKLKIYKIIETYRELEEQYKLKSSKIVLLLGEREQEYNINHEKYENEIKIIQKEIDDKDRMFLDMRIQLMHMKEKLDENKQDEDIEKNYKKLLEEEKRLDEYRNKLYTKHINKLEEFHIYMEKYKVENYNIIINNINEEKKINDDKLFALKNIENLHKHKELEYEIRYCELKAKNFAAKLDIENSALQFAQKTLSCYKKKG